MKKNIHLITSILFAGLVFTASAQTNTWTANPSEDAFVTDGTAHGAGASDNYGGAGALMVAGSNSGNGTFESLLQFNLSSVVTYFNTQLGVGDWALSTITLTLAGNASTQGGSAGNAIFPTINAGNFSISFLAANPAWIEGTGTPSSPGATGVTYDSLASLTSGSDASLGTFSFTPPGNNVQLTWSLGTASGLASDIESGGTASLLVAPANSTIAYLFNSESFGTAANHPLLSITAQAVPEPGTLASLLGGFASFASFAGFRRLRGPH